MTNLNALELEFGMQALEAPAQTTAEQDREYAMAKLSELGTKRAAILYLTASGWTRSRISKGLDIIYQHVRNEQLRIAKKK